MKQLERHFLCYIQRNKTRYLAPRLQARERVDEIVGAYTFRLFGNPPPMVASQWELLQLRQLQPGQSSHVTTPR